MRRTLFVLTVLLGWAILVPSASGATAKWWSCGKDGARAATEAAGLPAAMDADERLQETFGDEPPSAVLQLYRSYCADFDRDGDVDRAVLYACCTVSSPGPYAILRNDGGSWVTVYARLSDTVFRLFPRGGRLIVRSPKYGPRERTAVRAGSRSASSATGAAGGWAG